MTFAAAGIAGRLVDYDRLLVASGEATAAMGSDVYHSATFLASPYDPLPAAAASLGYQIRRARPADFGAARELITAELEAGRPVLAGGAVGAYGPAEWGLVTGCDRSLPWLRVTGYGHSGSRWLVARGEPGAHGHQPWRGGVRGLLAETNRLWFDCPLVLLGEPGGRPVEDDVAARALENCYRTMRAETHHIGYWGCVSFRFGIEALRQLSDELPGLDYPAILDAPQPPDSEDWYDLPSALSAVCDLVRRGRAAAAVMFRRWGDTLSRRYALKALAEVESVSAAAAEALWAEVTPQPPGAQWPDVVRNAEWRAKAATVFGFVADNDEHCVRELGRMLD